MAEPLQKVFMILVRPSFADGEIRKTVKSGLKVQDGVDTQGDPIYKTITTENTGVEFNDNSPTSINREEIFESDPWLLHSVYTSYEKFKAAYKSILSIYSTDDVKCAVYLPTGLEVTPFE